VLSTIDHILSSSQIIRKMVNNKKIKIVGAFYDLHTGIVEFL
jgi:carbonic anhydrase